MLGPVLSLCGAEEYLSLSLNSSDSHHNEMIQTRERGKGWGREGYRKKREGEMKREGEIKREGERKREAYVNFQIQMRKKGI